MEGNLQSCFGLLLKYGGGGGGGAGTCEGSFLDLTFGVSRLLSGYGGGGGVCRPNSLYNSIWPGISERSVCTGSSFEPSRAQILGYGTGYA